MKKILAYVIVGFLILISLIIAFEYYNQNLSEGVFCENLSYGQCELEKACVLGPSCPECLDIGCQTKGYADDWPSN